MTSTDAKAATMRLQRQLAFPPIGRRVMAKAARLVADAGDGHDATVVARQRMAAWLRRLARRRIERVRFAGGPLAFTWWAADAMEADLANVDWDWLAWYWVGTVRSAGDAPVAAVAEAPRATELPAGGGPGWPGPCPDGVTWERWLADNNVD